MKNINYYTYIAGFLDGDGCINAQIVRRKDYKLGFQIRVYIVFAQKSTRNWFIDFLHSIIKIGIIRHRKDGITEYTITGIKNVRLLMNNIYPYIIMKKNQADLIIEIMNELEKEQTKTSFLKLCKKVDQFAEFNDSKKRTINYNYVQSYYNSKI